MFGKITVAALAVAISGSATAAVRYVAPGGTGDGSSWANASGSLQQTIDDASAGDQIWVAAGTYAPERLIKSSKPTSKAFFLKDGVSLFGGFAGTESSLEQRAVGSEPYEMTNATILSADDDVPDVWVRQMESGSTYRLTWQLDNKNNVTGTQKNSSHLLYYASTLTQPVVIDGFTLTGANANVATAKPSGAAVYAAGDITVRNCRIVENSAYFSAESMGDCNAYGAAVYLNGGKLENSYIARTYCHSSYGNGYGGGVYAVNSDISGCTFIDCVAPDGGGGAYIDGGSLADCSFTDCYASAGGAIYNDGGAVSGVTVRNCRGLNGGGIYNNSGTVHNALVAGCYADATEYADAGGKGGALYLVSGDVDGLCAFNSSAFQGGGVFLAGSGRLINSTVNNNAVRDVAQTNPNLGNFSDANSLNCIVGATDMSGFAAPTSFSGFPADDAGRAALIDADWSLVEGSVYIDAGVAVEGFTSGTDLAGNPRVSGSAIDCGAYEYTVAERVPTIVLTFADGTETATIGTGGASGYEFTIDWGDGNEIAYSAQGYYSHSITGNTVKIYGDEIIVLRAGEQNILSADISRASMMIQAHLAGNGMTSLTLGNHPQLTGIYADNNNISSLNLSGCAALRVLDVHHNNLSGTIDCSAMEDLSKVDIAENSVSSLVLPKHNTLYEVDCSDNLIADIDVTDLAGLDSFSASRNQLTSIDLSGMSAATEIYLDGNALTTVNLSGLSSLEKIMAAENEISSIDLSVCPTLSGVYLQDNALTALDMTANPNVRWLNVGNNNIAAIDVSAQRYLSIFIANNNELSNIDLSQNTSLSSLDLAGNNLTSVNVGSAPYLSQCHLEDNNLTALDVTKNSYLYGLFCSNNALTSLDLSKNTYLQRLEAHNNNIASLDITANTGLQEILVQGNNFDTAAMTAFINALPDVSAVEVTPGTEDFLRQLNISYMPGTPAADIAAAQAKGWYVTADYNVGIVEDLAGAQIVGTVYTNAAGLTSDKPFDGLNIVTVKYSDGRVLTRRVLLRP